MSYRSRTRWAWTSTLRVAPFSVFKGDTPSCVQFQIRWFSPTVLSILVLLSIVEGLLHIPLVRSVLPQPNPYYDPGVETRLRALNAVLAEHGSIDLLFVGSSVVRTNIQPLLFDELIFQKTGSRIVSFNGGLSALTPEPTSLYLEHFWLKKASPTVVVQSVRLGELLSSSSAKTQEPLGTGVLEPLWASNTAVNKLKARAIENVQLLYYAGTLAETLRFFQYPINGPRGFAIDSRGYSATRRTLAEVWEQGLPLDRKAYSGEVATPDFFRNLAVLQRTIQFCRQNGIEYVLVNMPEHRDKFLAQPDGNARYASYIEHLEALAKSEGIPFVDLTDGALPGDYSDAHFSDYHHMSVQGATRFTTQLATFFADHIAQKVGALE